ncbi:hypothetical protein MCOR02_009051 [Pyricularia oryzae]|uniref:Rhodopsin domain-containing protein n=2 Tax=Pyricularia TaxID=48558 RepID=A0ABQ8NQS6_PYRGI|nr:hypothetical protein MCOR01_005019 [Pyricularia oryzae]KAI6300201.1 hypothetical protein MCOR33_003996 [Pyricularia grisea]KAH9431775.1 hypothetical protein MCOR02_009051 [Pyricularia oryzae]KAI6261063.1 hypothetical protein MCOR19_002607 [Pyricularia oryzae]KAI6317589.1 hypothetical protein MCOR29_006285 [Pyricularia oryzae]
MIVDHSLDHEDMSGVVVGVVSVCLVLITLAVAARVYTRLVILRTFGPDDYAAVLSLFFTFACGLVIGMMVRHGSGKHVWTLQPSDIEAYLIEFYLSIVFYNASIMATKAAFLLQYYRVLAVNRGMKRIYLGFLILIAAWCFGFVLVAIFQCSPISDFWSSAPTRNCLPNMPYWKVQGVSHIITDILVFTLPLPALYQLHINGTQKLVLMGIFSLGFFACAISVIRLRYLVVAEDVTWDNTVPSIWSTTEVTIGLLCACLPTLRPLVGRLFPKLVSTFNKSLAGPGGESGAGIGYHKGASKAGGGHSKNRSLVTTSSTFSKARSAYRENSGSVERLRVDVNGTDPSSAVKEESFLDDISEAGSPRGFNMQTFGTKTKVTTGRDQARPVDSWESPSLPAGQIRVSRDVYQTQS